MAEMNENFEDAIITKIRIEECIKEFEPEIQQIFYDSYGESLDAIPQELLLPGCRTEEMLERLLKFSGPRAQKVILMRFGIMTGSPMTLEEVANELGITRERVRQIESMFLRRSRPHIRRKKLVDYLND